MKPIFAFAFESKPSEATSGLMVFSIHPAHPSVSIDKYDIPPVVSYLQEQILG